MRTVRRPVLLSLGAVLAFACEQRIMAPGACPEYCPTNTIQVVDTLLFDGVADDGSFDGYWEYYEGFSMQAASDDADIPGRGVMRFLRFPINTTIDGANVTISPPDSFRIDIVLERRNLVASNLEVAIFRIPFTVDTSTTFADLDPFFQDSTLVGLISLGDTASPDTISAILPGDAFPSFVADTFVAAVGIGVRADGPTYTTLGTIEGGQGATLTRFATVDSAGTTQPRADIRGVAFDTFVRPPVAPVVQGTLLLGAEPTSRSLLRLGLPSVIIDSSQIVGANLIIFPVAPAEGAPADTFRIQPIRLTADFGPKSPFTLVLPSDSVVEQFGTAVAVGSSDSVVIDVTEILRQWQADSLLPNSLMLRVFPEGGSLAELRIGGGGNVGFAPVLRIAFVPPFKFDQ